ncbi:hypothetical protein NTGBS_1050003 [Candidatus Nitrotoga sp. BS]|nr:hypothetical protein NTGBS_1050003 [Candidatus Nitrotoga sp. BS]
MIQETEVLLGKLMGIKLYIIILIY